MGSHSLTMQPLGPISHLNPFEDQKSLLVKANDLFSYAGLRNDRPAGFLSIDRPRAIEIQVNQPLQFKEKCGKTSIFGQK